MAAYSPRKIFQRLHHHWSLRHLSASCGSAIENIELIRNVGIMAHIDAGKTTTTEQMLYYSGFIRRTGNVDDGNTVMDYMKQERERGITINSAAVTFNWKGYKLNLIDTPVSISGHVDFTFEVERSLQVLDGAVAIFDASAGVEPQTISVWRQANRYKVPRIAFFNKMDKPNSHFHEAVVSLREKLPDTVPLLTQYPIGRGKDFSGVVDLVSMEMLLWRPDDGGEVIVRPLSWHQSKDLEDFVGLNSFMTSSLAEEIFHAREQLIEQLAMHDDVIMEKVLSNDCHSFQLDEQVLRTSLKKATCDIESGCVPLLFGSSLKNKGIQPLLDAVIDYLPSPVEKSFVIPQQFKDFLAFAFKVVHDRKRGPLVYLRMYSGSIRPNLVVYNATRSIEERISRLLLMLADEPREMSEMNEGNIAVVAGLKHTVTGDVITLPSKSSKTEFLSKLQFKTLHIPQPMFFCSIEPESASYQKDLDYALSCLSREDPSLRVSVDDETGQTMLSGMGELHLEIIIDRIRQEYKVPAELGKLQVAYREAPTIPITLSDSLVRTYGNHTHSVTMDITVEPSHDVIEPQLVYSKDTINCPTNISYSDIIGAIQNGIELACQRGPVLCYPVSHVQVTVHHVQVNQGTSLPVVTACTTSCVSKALRESQGQLLEPLMELSITLPHEYLTVVLSDLTSLRRAQVLEIKDASDVKTLSVLVPVASLTGYSTQLRSFTSGTASFSAKFSHYQLVAKDVERDIIKQIRGF